MMFRRSATVLSLVVSNAWVNSALAERCSEWGSSSESDSDRPTITLHPGQSIQAALDSASDGTVIRLMPGDYSEEGNGNELYGLHVTKNNIKLIAADFDSTSSSSDYADTSTVRILRKGEQKVGVYVAPDGENCGYKDKTCAEILCNFSIKGIVVEGFEDNGIQTRFVDGVEIINSKSVDNFRNGIYPTYSTNGVVRGCTARGSSRNSGIWIGGCRHFMVYDNEIFDSITGLEVTVSKDVMLFNNHIYNNVVGIGMYHANMAGTEPDFFPFDNWVYENNTIHDNNRENTAPEDSFASSVPSGTGILMVGIRGQIVRNNIVEGHNATGFLMAGLCTVLSVLELDCVPEDGDPSANYNTIVHNTFIDNANVGLPPTLGPLGGIKADIIYLQSSDELMGKANENCFQDNVSSDGGDASSFATDGVSTSIPLPTGGCD